VEEKEMTIEKEATSEQLLLVQLTTVCVRVLKNRCEILNDGDMLKRAAENLIADIIRNLHGATIEWGFSITQDQLKNSLFPGEE
jgi:hypothetical protein